MSKYRKIIYVGIIIMLVAFATITLVYMRKHDDIEQIQEQPKTVITVWTKDRHDLDFYTKKVNEYNANNTDNIRVEYEVFSNNYKQAVENAFYSSKAPDMMVYTTQIFDQYDNGRYADLTGFMDDEFKETFSEAMIDNVNVIDGKCYYIPTSATTCRLIYNSDILEKAGIENPPSTMEELIEAARTINQKFSSKGIYGFAMDFKNPQSALNRSFMKQINVQFGIKTGYDFSTGRYDFTVYEDLVSKWRELLSEDCSYPNCQYMDIDPLRKLFASGKIAMYMSYSHSELGAYTEQYKMKQSWGCTTLPTLSGVDIKGVQNYNLNNGYLFNANSPNIDKAWKVYREIFANIDNLKEYYSLGLGISIIPEVLNGADRNSIVDEIPGLLISDDQRIWPLVPHEINKEAVNISGANQYQEITQLIFGNDDIKETLLHLTQRYNDAYDAGILEGLTNKIKIDNFNPFEPQIIE